MQGDSCCREDKKPELQGAFGTKKPKLFKVERTTSRRSESGYAAPQSFWGSLLFLPSLPNSEISKQLIFQYSLQLNSYIKTREMAVPPLAIISLFYKLYPLCFPECLDFLPFLVQERTPSNNFYLCTSLLNYTQLQTHNSPLCYKF